MWHGAQGHRGQEHASGADEPQGELRHRQGRRGARLRHAHQPLRAGQHLQHRPASAEEAAAAQEPDSSSRTGGRQDGLFAHPASGVFEGRALQDGAGALQGQKAARQARRHGGQGCAARHSARPALKEPRGRLSAFAPICMGVYWFRRDCGRSGKRAVAPSHVKIGKLKMN